MNKAVSLFKFAKKGSDYLPVCADAWQAMRVGALLPELCGKLGDDGMR